MAQRRGGGGGGGGCRSRGVLEMGAKQVGRAVRLKRDHMKAESMKCENRFAKGRNGPAAAALHKLALCVCSVIQ